MTSIKGHFDGRNVVLDEPATLAVGQVVRVVVETNAHAEPDLDNMSDDELAEWLEVETHKLRGVPYNHQNSSTDFWDNPCDDKDWNGN